MKQIRLLAGVVAALALLLVVTAAAAFAEEPEQNIYGPGWCLGAVGGAGGSGFMDPLSTNQITKLLGISRDDLVTQLQAGKSLAEMAQAKGVSQDTLVETLLAPHQDRLAIQVKYGYLTPAQADQALQQAQAAAQVAVEATGTPAGSAFGRRGGLMGPGMMGGFGLMGPGMMGGYGRWQSTPNGSRATPGTSAAPGRFGGMMGWRW